jgi:hypothetical protein
MQTRLPFAVMLGLLAASAALHAAPTLEPLHKFCTIAATENGAAFHVRVGDDPCPDDHHCNGSNFNHDPFTGFTGLTIADLGREGAHLTATYSAEAGTFTCTGDVHDAELRGQAVFTPDPGFADRMEKMGFSGYDAEKLMTCAFIGVDSGWVRSMQQTGIHGLTSDNIIALRIFKADPDYIRQITSMGFAMPTADQLVGLKVQGVNPEEVREIRSLGFEPTLDELVQIRIFKITPDFIRRMQARGLKNLTIAKLVQIRIFNLAE